MENGLVTEAGFNTEETVNFFIQRLEENGDKEWINSISVSIELCLKLSM